MSEVTQADREAAADLLDELSNLLDHNGIGQVADLIRDGEYDEHEATIAFVRHRDRGKIEGARLMQERAAGATRSAAHNCILDCMIERYGQEACSHASELLNAMADELAALDPEAVVNAPPPPKP